MNKDDLPGERLDLLDLNEIMLAFGVDDWTNLGLLENLSGEQPQILVESGGRRYILKERPETFAVQESNHHYTFQRYLASQGIPVAALRLTPEGEPFVTLGDESFELQEWTAGEIFDSGNPWGRTWIVAAGEMLGRIHQAVRSYSGPQYRWPSEVQAGGLTQGWLNFARRKAEQCEVYAIAAAISELVDAWEAALPAAMMAIGTGRGLPEFHIHGDYSVLNLRFNTGGVSEVLGLEASRWEKRLLEVAYGVFYFAGLEWHTDHRLTRPLARRGLDPERASLFLRGYRAVYPAVPGEAALLVDALNLVAPVITVNGPLEDIFYSPEGLAAIPVEDALERLTWATALPGWLAKVRRSFAEMW